jgi:predicted nucleic acid-binding protein
MTTYVDASVLLRVIQGSPDALLSWKRIVPISSQLIRVECLRVIDRARAKGMTDDMAAARDRTAVLAALSGFTLVEIGDQILVRAADPFPTALGTLDAIHLATALEQRAQFPELTFATHDRELALAAQAVGFTVEGV